MFRSLLIVLITLLPQASFAASDAPHDHFACGVSQIEVFNSSDVKQPYFTIKISNANQNIKLRYSVRNEFLFARCDTNSQNSPLLLIQHFCGGSGCAASFGIVEPKSLHVLLAPSQGMEGNVTEATKIMGHEIKAFKCKTPSRTSQGGQSNGEYCYVSPIELG